MLLDIIKMEGHSKKINSSENSNVENMKEIIVLKAIVVFLNNSISKLCLKYLIVL